MLKRNLTSSKSKAITWTNPPAEPFLLPFLTREFNSAAGTRSRSPETCVSAHCDSNNREGSRRDRLLYVESRRPAILDVLYDDNDDSELKGPASFLDTPSV